MSILFHHPDPGPSCCEAMELIAVPLCHPTERGKRRGKGLKEGGRGREN